MFHNSRVLQRNALRLAQIYQDPCQQTVNLLSLQYFPLKKKRERFEYFENYFFHFHFS